MADYDLRQFQLRLLEILKGIDSMCRKYGLTYYMEGGTLLGAVRHQGFIPWDDDIDIAMPRPDYDMLKVHAAEWLPQPLRLMNGYNTPHYHHPFAKIVDSSTHLVERNLPMGLYVDVFPIDGMTSSRFAQRVHLLSFHYVTTKLLYFCSRNPYKHGHGISSWLPLLCQSLYGYDRAVRGLDKKQSEYAYDSHDLVIEHSSNERGIMPKDVFGNPKELFFEGCLFYAPEHTEEYLTRVYGSNYMTPPPPEKRHVHYFSEVKF